MRFAELVNRMRELWKNGQTAYAEIEFSNETPSWDKHDWSREERTYGFSNQEKYFGDYIGSSLYASNRAGTEQCIRLDWYLGDWLIADCRITEVLPASFVTGGVA